MNNDRQTFWLNLIVFGLIVALLFLLLGTVRAQEAGAGIPTDLSSWFVDSASLAAVVVALTAFTRKHLWTSLDGFYVVVFDILLGVVLAVVGHFLGYVDGGLSGALIFGGAAGMAAAGGVDGLRAILGGDRLSENSSTRTDAARLRRERPGPGEHPDAVALPGIPDAVALAGSPAASAQGRDLGGPPAGSSFPWLWSATSSRSPFRPARSSRARPPRSPPTPTAPGTTRPGSASSRSGRRFRSRT